MDRIISNGGRVKKRDNLDPSLIDISPLRAYPGGLSVSRAFGDVFSKVP